MVAALSSLSRPPTIAVGGPRAGEIGSGSSSVLLPTGIDDAVSAAQSSAPPADARHGDRAGGAVDDDLGDDRTGRLAENPGMTDPAESPPATPSPVPDGNSLMHRLTVKLGGFGRPLAGKRLLPLYGLLRHVGRTSGRR